jgi:site-specific recombinase XerD
MTLAVVRSLDSPRRLRSPAEVEEFEQEIVDQFALAMVGAGLSDGHIASERSVVIEFIRFLGEPVWTAAEEDADRYLTWLRRDRGLARSTVEHKAAALARFFDFTIARYQGDIHALTGVVVGQPIDEFNRPTSTWTKAVRVPPGDDEVDRLFTGWGNALPDQRKYLPSARDYVAASLWRRVGLRLNETVMLDLRDWRPDLGEHGKLHVRFGKGAKGRGPKTRLVPAINGVDRLLQWWLSDVRHQFGDDWEDPDAPMFPSERHDRFTGRPSRVGPDALRSGLETAVGRWLPQWRGRLTPHGLRHYCASSLYHRGVALKAVQELLGHEWLKTTTIYVHVHDDHIEQAWAAANQRLVDRFDLGTDPRLSVQEG